MHPIKGIIFDLGRVLVNVDINRGYFRYLRASSKTDQSLSQMMRDDLMAAYNTGRLTPEQFYVRLCQRFNIVDEFERFKVLWCSVFSEMPGMFELVSALKRNFRLGMLSDTDPLHWAHICQHFPIVRFFEKPTLSFQTGVLKPDPKAFLAAAKSLDLPPTDCLYIDDLADNVAGAKKVGMDAVQFVSVSDLKKQLQTRHIDF